MSKIHVLNQALANKIAAGEVVERPSNVIKELVENAIDANATKIEIYIKLGGIEQMIVQDNGDGMSYEDLTQSILRHATSKIQDDHDLMRIATLGFRGEALPSIASVSELIIESSTQHDGGRIEIHGGQMIQSAQGIFRKGARVIVSNLFINIPARLKYLKSPSSEYTLIYDLVQKLSLSHPEIAFTLYSDDRLAYKTNGNKQLLEVISHIYSHSVASNMIPIAFNNDDYIIDGFISKLELTRSNKSHIHVLLNNRVIKNHVLVDAINLAYRSFIFEQRFPIVVLNIHIDFYLVDVNVHPSKWEVRFSNEVELAHFITNQITNVLQKTNLIYQVEHVQPKKEWVVQEQLPMTYNTSSQFDNVKANNESITTEMVKQLESLEQEETKIDIVNSDNYQAEQSHKQINHEELKPVKIHLEPIGQIHGTYLIASTQSGMYIIDQHAAQERIYYEYFQDKFLNNNQDAIYDLLVPLTFSFTQLEYHKIDQQNHLLKNVGIYLEPFGSTTFRVTQLPVWLSNIDEQIYIEEMLELILSQQQISMLKIQKDAIATLACKASIKANQFLTKLEMQTLLDDLMRCESPSICPHGRPTIIEYKIYDLEKMFKRVV